MQKNIFSILKNMGNTAMKQWLKREDYGTDKLFGVERK